jgi:CubicO group peptidase (beta-lactamase class C family)
MTLPSPLDTSRRRFLFASLGAAVGTSLAQEAETQPWNEAVRILRGAVDGGLIRSAVIHVTSHREKKPDELCFAFGKDAFSEAMFLLGSISKPIVITGLMTLFEKGAFRLEDKIARFLPAFRGDGREDVTVRDVLTHTSGLPDQVAHNAELRKNHAPLPEFIRAAERTPLQFKPGSRYEYSSMGILLAAHIAEIVTGEDIRAFTHRTVLEPLGMKRSAQGLGGFELKDVEPMQIEHAAPEAGGGDPSSAGWGWNSPYWRSLGAPWGGTHASAGDVSKWLSEFLLEQGRVLHPDTARRMTSNHNPAAFPSRGLAFDVGPALARHGVSERVFGHTGSTGTIAWADPVSRTVCVVLTTLPARAVTPHPRDLASDAVARSAASMRPGTRG